MPTDQTNPSENERAKATESPETEVPIDERDEVKMAEARTRQLQKEAEGPSQNTKDADK